MSNDSKGTFVLETYDDILDEVLVKLRRARQELQNEISSYPSPISGCDAQFNRLLSDRTRISNAIGALEDQPFVPTPRMLEPGINCNSWRLEASLSN